MDSESTDTDILFNIEEIIVHLVRSVGKMTEFNKKLGVQGAFQIHGP